MKKIDEKFDDVWLPSRRRILICAMTFPIYSGCIYSRYYNLGWEEEVKLQDGSIVLVKLNFKHERRSRTSKYDLAILRETTLTFDSGLPFGKVKQIFTSVQPMLLNKFNGTWYVVIRPEGSTDDLRKSVEEWGRPQTSSYQWPLKLTAEGFRPIQLADFPDQIVDMNLLAYLPPAAMADLDGLTLREGGQKTALMRKYTNLLPFELRGLRKSLQTNPI